MTRAELNYFHRDQKNQTTFKMEGRICIKGIGRCQIESNNDADRTVSIAMISSLVEPRSSRLIAILKPGESFENLNYLIDLL
jgi:hypothetical protein